MLNAEPSYLYHVPGEDWWVSGVPGIEEGWLKNESKSETVPTTGWKYLDDDGKQWHSDPSIKITPGKLVSVCDTITIKGDWKVVTMQPDSLGTFTRTDKWFNGKPVFINDKGWYLHSGNGGGWNVGEKIGKYFIHSKTAPLCPAKAEEWVSWTGQGSGRVKPATISVSCSTHNQPITKKTLDLEKHENQLIFICTK